MIIAKIQAWKSTGQGGKTVTNLTDPEATIFSISYSGMRYSSNTFDFDSLYQAERMVAALKCAFNAGKLERSEEIRKLLGA